MESKQPNLGAADALGRLIEPLGLTLDCLQRKCRGRYRSSQLVAECRSTRPTANQSLITPISTPARLPQRVTNRDGNSNL
jgi:hypothetical protein